MSIPRVPLPKVGTKFRYHYNTSFLDNVNVLDSVLRKVKLEKHYRKGNAKILDVYSANGLFSSMLQNKLLPQQHILMENRKSFNTFLTEHIAGLPSGHTFDLQNMDPYAWKSFLELTDESKILQPGFESRDHIHSNFLFTGYCTNEGLLMQWLACLANQNWIQRFGNVKMLLWVSNASAMKIMATPGAANRAKCSVTRETFSNTKLIAIPNDKDIKHYNRDLLARDEPILIEADALGGHKVPLALLEIDPVDHQLDTYVWDFVVKQLMASKIKPLSEGLNVLGPAASDFFESHLPVEYWTKTPKELTSEEFKEIARVFELWPFKPRALVDVIEDQREI